MNLESQLDKLDLTKAIEAIDGAVPETETQSTAAEMPLTTGGAPVYVPIEPQTLAEAGLTESDVEALILKFLNAYGNNQGRMIAKHIKLPFGIIQGILNNLKNQLYVTYKSLTAGNDYVYELTDDGHQRTRHFLDICSYCGAAPVGFDKYVESVRAQSMRNHRLSPREVNEAFEQLLLPREMLAQIGQAVNSGRCMFLYGESGNGKTSVATRCVEAYDSGIWIPRTLTVGGEIIRLFDPSIHEPLPTNQADSIFKKSGVFRIINSLVIVF